MLVRQEACGATRDCHEGVDGHALRVFREGCQLVQQAHTVLGALPQADDAPRTHIDACLPHSFQRVQAVLFTWSPVKSQATLCRTLGSSHSGNKATTEKMAVRLLQAGGLRCTCTHACLPHKFSRSTLLHNAMDGEGVGQTWYLREEVMVE